MVEVWFADHEAHRARLVSCDSPEPLTRDSEGRVMYVNTHFATEAEAWAKVLREVAAWQQLAARDLRDARERADRAEKALVEAAMARVLSERAFEDWQAGKAIGSKEPSGGK